MPHRATTEMKEIEGIAHATFLPDKLAPLTE